MSTLPREESLDRVFQMMTLPGGRQPTAIGKGWAEQKPVTS